MIHYERTNERPNERDNFSSDDWRRDGGIVNYWIEYSYEFQGGNQFYFAQNNIRKIEKSIPNKMFL